MINPVILNQPPHCHSEPKVKNLCHPPAGPASLQRPFASLRVTGGATLRHSRDPSLRVTGDRGSAQGDKGGQHCATLRTLRCAQGDKRNTQGDKGRTQGDRGRTNPVILNQPPHCHSEPKVKNLCHPPAGPASLQRPFASLRVTRGILRVTRGGLRATGEGPTLSL